MLNGAPRANYALGSSGFASLIFDLGSQGVAHHRALLLWGYYFGSSVCGRPPALAFRGREHLASQSPSLLCLRTTSLTAMGNETVLESVQVFGRKVSQQCGSMAAPFSIKG